MKKLLILNYGVNPDIIKVNLIYERHSRRGEGAYFFAQRLEASIMKSLFFYENVDHPEILILDYLMKRFELNEIENDVIRAVVNHYVSLVLNGDFEVIKIDESYFEIEQELVELPFDNETFFENSIIVDLDKILADRSNAGLKQIDSNYFNLAVIGLLYHIGEIERHDIVTNFYDLLKTEGIQGEGSRFKSFIKQTKFAPGNSTKERTNIKRRLRLVFNQKEIAPTQIEDFEKYHEYLVTGIFTKLDDNCKNFLLKHLIKESDLPYTERIDRINNALNEYIN